jgi:hypothetical protein
MHRGRARGRGRFQISEFGLKAVCHLGKANAGFVGIGISPLGAASRHRLMRLERNGRRASLFAFAFARRFHFDQSEFSRSRQRKMHLIRKVLTLAGVDTRSQGTLLRAGEAVCRQGFFGTGAIEYDGLKRFQCSGDGLNPPDIPSNRCPTSSGFHNLCHCIQSRP